MNSGLPQAMTTFSQILEAYWKITKPGIAPSPSPTTIATTLIKEPDSFHAGAVYYLAGSIAKEHNIRLKHTPCGTSFARYFKHQEKIADLLIVAAYTILGKQYKVGHLFGISQSDVSMRGIRHERSRPQIESSKKIPTGFPPDETASFRTASFRSKIYRNLAELHALLRFFEPSFIRNGTLTFQCIGTLDGEPLTIEAELGYLPEPFRFFVVAGFDLNAGNALFLAGIHRFPLDEPKITWFEDLEPQFLAISDKAIDALKQSLRGNVRPTPNPCSPLETNEGILFHPNTDAACRYIPQTNFIQLVAQLLRHAYPESRTTGEERTWDALALAGNIDPLVLKAWISMVKINGEWHVDLAKVHGLKTPSKDIGIRLNGCTLTLAESDELDNFTFQIVMDRGINVLPPDQVRALLDNARGIYTILVSAGYPIKAPRFLPNEPTAPHTSELSVKVSPDTENCIASGQTWLPPLIPDGWIRSEYGGW